MRYLHTPVKSSSWVRVALKWLCITTEKARARQGRSQKVSREVAQLGTTTIVQAKAADTTKMVGREAGTTRETAAQQAIQH